MLLPKHQNRTSPACPSAFGHEYPYIDALLPDHNTALGRKYGGERLLAIKNYDPNTIFIKVVEEESGQMIALVKWNVYDGVVLELEGDFREGEEEKAYAGLLAPRRRAIREMGGRLVCEFVAISVRVGADERWRRQRWISWRSILSIRDEALDACLLDGGLRLRTRWAMR